MRKVFSVLRFAVVSAMVLAGTACGGGGASGGGGPVVPPPPLPSAIVTRVWVTTPDQTKLLEAQPNVSLAAGAATGTVITVNPAERFQSIVGFGASMTDASAYVINTHMTPSQRDALMSDLFGPDQLNLSFTRLTIGASDMSRAHYSYNDMPAGMSDPTLSTFSIAPARDHVIPVTKQALATNPKLTVMASPWSAPGWMKTTDSLIGGDLKTEAYPYLAEYLVRYVKAMQAEGVPIYALTIQNEPGFTPTDYPGMYFGAPQRAAFIGSHLGPRLAAEGLTTRILDYDHNWDQAVSPLAVLADATANPYISGVAWHCYGGDVSAQTTVRDAYPAKDVFFTECSGGDWAPEWGGSFQWMVRNLIIGGTRNWARGVLFWNLALDENKGPNLGGCATCRGVVTINSTTGAVTRNLEYYALGHASRFVKPGAVRIGSNNAGGIETVAFRNEDGSMALLALNTNAASKTFAVQSGERSFSYTLVAGSVATFVWTP